MSDPIGDRLRSYYRSLDAEPPIRLEARASQAMTSDVRRVSRHWRLRFLAAAAAILAVAAIVGSLALRNMSAGPAATPSGAPTPVSTPTASPSGTQTSTETPSIPPSIPAPTPTPSPTPTATPTAGATPVGAFGKAFTNSVGRSGYTVTSLENAGVLIAGGIGSGFGSAGPLSIAQIWDPRTGQFTKTGSTIRARCQHTATLLHDGRVLIVGGADLMDGIDNLASAELYDPRTGKFTMTGSMSHGRAYHTATLLIDGRVLIAGGYGGGTEPLATAELYDPATGKFSKTGSMSVARDRHTATYVGTKVLIAGGMGLEGALSSAELYDPSTGRFAPTAQMKVARYGHAATSFVEVTRPDQDKALVAGGMGSNGKALASAEVYDPLDGTFKLTQPMHAARSWAQAVAATPGLVIVAGAGSSAADFFDPDGTFRASGPLAAPGETATLFGECQVLLSAPGGKTWQVFTASTCPPAT